VVAPSWQPRPKNKCWLFGATNISWRAGTQRASPVLLYSVYLPPHSHPHPVCLSERPRFYAIVELPSFLVARGGAFPSCMYSVYHGFSLPALTSIEYRSASTSTSGLFTFSTTGLSYINPTPLASIQVRGAWNA
jgi:hypothetical protein